MRTPPAIMTCWIFERLTCSCGTTAHSASPPNGRANNTSTCGDHDRPNPRSAMWVKPTAERRRLFAAARFRWNFETAVQLCEGVARQRLAEHQERLEDIVAV